MLPLNASHRLNRIWLADVVPSAFVDVEEVAQKEGVDFQRLADFQQSVRVVPKVEGLVFQVELAVELAEVSVD